MSSSSFKDSADIVSIASRRQASRLCRATSASAVSLVAACWDAIFTGELGSGDVSHSRNPNASVLVLKAAKEPELCGLTGVPR